MGTMQSDTSVINFTCLKKLTVVTFSFAGNYAQHVSPNTILAGAPSLLPLDLVPPKMIVIRECFFPTPEWDWVQPDLSPAMWGSGSARLLLAQPFYRSNLLVLQGFCSAMKFSEWPNAPSKHTKRSIINKSLCTAIHLSNPHGSVKGQNPEELFLGLVSTSMNWNVLG